MTTMTEIQTTQVYQVFILATPEKIWEAITNSDFTRQYFYASEVEFAGGRRIARGPNGELWGDEPVVEWKPPHKLVHQWRSQYDPELAAEATSRVSWEIEPQDGGVTKLTVIHDQLEGAPKTAQSVAGGWMYILSGLKTLLETGKSLQG